jgi:hypothetical protein
VDPDPHQNVTDPQHWQLLCESTPDLIDEELSVPDDHLLVEDAHALGRHNGGQVVEEVLKVRVVLVIRLATVHTRLGARKKNFVKQTSVGLEI